MKNEKDLLEAMQATPECKACGDAYQTWIEAKEMWVMANRVRVQADHAHTKACVALEATREWKALCAFRAKALSKKGSK